MTTEILRTNLREQVLAVLRQRLVSGELRTGEIYSAQALAAELGISGSPVREAMLTLVNQGLMVPVRNRGFMVVEVNDKDGAEILEMRLWLEVPAMAKLAGEASQFAPHEPRFRVLANEIVESARKGDIVAFLASDREFHLGLTELLDNQRLTSAIGELRDQTRLYGLEGLKERGQLVESAQVHLDLLDALLLGDADRTGELMAGHMRQVMGDWAGTEQ